MRIGIYARGLSERSGGVKVYIYELTKAIIEEISKDDELFIFHNLTNNIFPKKTNAHEIIMKSSSKFLCDFVIAPYYINKYNPDFVLFPKNVVPYFIKAKKVVTIHDLAYFMPEYNAYKFFDTLYMKFMIRSSCKRADKIIAISNNTKKDLINILDVPEEKIKVVYEGVNSKYKIISDKKSLENIREKYHLHDPFIFYAGSISPRKNIKMLISAYQKLPKDINMNLVITGNKLWNNKKEMVLIKQNPRIKLLGFVPEEDLPYFYNLASLYIYPSLYEGFGLPILEAQACGCPVICSNISSLPEVANNSAILIDPYNEDEITKALIKIITERGLREELIRKGLQNIKRFSWINTAKQTLEVLKNA